MLSTITGINQRILLLLVLFMMLTVFSTYVSAKVNPKLDSSAAGKIINVSGKVEVLPATRSIWKKAGNGQLLYPGDSVRTGRNGKASLIMSDETMMQLNRNTYFQLKEVERNAGWFDLDKVVSAAKSIKESLYSVLGGKVWVRNKNRDVSARFKTPSMTAGIKGTELTIEVDSDGNTSTVVLEGSVEHINDFGRIVANKGESVVAQPGAAPVKQVILNPEEAVQWTLLIPPVFNERALVSNTLSADVQISINDAITSKMYLDAAEKVAAERRKADSKELQILDAILDIYLGSPVQAKLKLQNIQESGFSSGSFWRALAITSLLTNDSELALEAAKNAIQLEPDLPASTLVMAYVHQSRYDLELAQELLSKLAERENDNVQVLVMLAQLQFARGFNELAWKTMMRAQAIDPDSAHVNNLAGFILLALRKHDEATNAFNQALENDAGMAESHMGLGLLAMRDGKVDLALEEITTAVALEPQRAIYLSYWGKMLYQVKRFDKALDMFDHANKLDPNDPTPAFYKAIILRDLNRHGEAIASMNEAVAKNDNRGVYRSRFLLDEDLATRNVDLSILYERLGLSRWAELKAVSAIKSDYTNYSAHLFFAGALLDDEDRSYAFGSESLLARLLMPANVNSFNTFNEYTTMFEQPDVSGQISVGVGTQNTAAGEAIAYGAIPDSSFAWNIGVFGGTTDGWRDTNFEQEATAAFIGKWQPTEKNGIFVSTLLSEYEQGDKRYPRYEYDDPASPDDRLNLGLAGIELGYHHNASPGDDFLAYVTWQGSNGDAFSTETALVVAPSLYTQTDTRSDFERPYAQLQLQYMKKAGNHQVIAGAVGFSGESSLSGVEQIDAVDKSAVPPVVTPLFTNTLDNKLDIASISVYVQDNWNISQDWYLEAALYYDNMDNGSVTGGDTWTVDEINPRLGLIWSPGTRHTLRLAAFSYMLPFVSSRTDPTEVVGIPISRNTVEGAQTDEANFVWEYEQSYGLYSLGLYTLEKSNQVSSTSTLEGKESGGQVGLDMLITPTIGLFTSYGYKDVEDQLQPDIDREDHLLTLGLKHQSSSGFSAGITQLFRATRFDSSREDEDIPITDLELGYEFSDKAGRVDLLVSNVFDEQFNWVVDRFTLVGRNPAREVLLTATFNF